MKAPELKNVAVGVSGGGRSLENFLRRHSDDYRIAGVIASREDCRGVTIARDAGLPLFIGDFSTKASEKTEGELYDWLAVNQIDLVALAGFLKIYPVRPEWAQRVLNIHPALLPKFGGKGMYGNHVHAAVLEKGELFSGATVHFVDARYDEGRILARARVEVRPSDTVTSLAARVFAAECELYPRVLAQVARGEIP